MTTEYDSEAIESMQAGWRLDQEERDRLRDVNAELLAALYAAKSGYESILPYTAKNVREVVKACLCDARDAIAKAERS